MAEEVTPLKARLAVRNGGRGGGQQSMNSIRGVAYYNLTGGNHAPTPERVSEAAEGLHAWVIKENSILRAVLVFLSSGDSFFSAQCFNKSLRAFMAKL